MRIVKPSGDHHKEHNPLGALRLVTYLCLGSIWPELETVTMLPLCKSYNFPFRRQTLPDIFLIFLDFILGFPEISLRIDKTQTRIGKREVTFKQF